MLMDRYGLALSTASPAARDAYVEGSALVLTLYPGAVAAFERAVAADLGFALAHAGRARAMQIAGDIPGAKAAIAAAETFIDGSADREAGHVATLALLVAREIEPDVHIFTRSKLPWVGLPPQARRFEEYYDMQREWPAESLARRRAILGDG